MKKFEQYLKNVLTWWMLIINVVLYGIVLFLYVKCIDTIQTTIINSENVLEIMFNYPGASIGVLLSGIFLNLLSAWIYVVAISGIFCLFVEKHEKKDLIIAVLNCVLAILVFTLNILYVKIFWSILIVLLVMGIIIYLIYGSN